MAENSAREKREDKHRERKTGRETGEMSAILSVWALLAKSSFYKVLAVVLLMAAVEMALFYRTLQNGWMMALEVQIEKSGAHRLFLAALGAVFFILIWTERTLDSAGRYTMMRLRIAGERLFVIRTAYNMLCLLVLFAAQAGLVFWFAWIYGRTPEMQNLAEEGNMMRQVVFMAFYCSEFLHGLFPMAEVGKWVRNVLLFLAFGMEAAGGAGRRHAATQAPLFVLTALCFAGSIGTGWPDVVCDMVFLVMIVADVREALAFRREMRLCRETGQSSGA